MKLPQQKFDNRSARLSLALCLLVCVLHGCSTGEKLDGNFFVSAYPVSYQMAITIAPIVAIVIGAVLCRVRENVAASLAGGTFMLAGALVLAVYAPDALLDRITVDDKHAVIHEGNWWHPTVCELRFADLQYVIRRDKELKAVYKLEHMWRDQVQDIYSSSSPIAGTNLANVTTTITSRRVMAPVYIRQDNGGVKPYLVYAGNRDVIESKIPIEDMLTEAAAAKICQNFAEAKISSQAWHRADFRIENKVDEKGRLLPIEPDTLAFAYDRLRKDDGVYKTHQSLDQPDCAAIIYDADTTTLDKIVHPVEFAWKLKIVDVNDRPIDAKAAKKFMAAPTVPIAPKGGIPLSPKQSSGGNEARIPSEEPETTKYILRRAEFRTEPMDEWRSKEFTEELQLKLPGVLKWHLEHGDKHWCVVIYDSKQISAETITKALARHTSVSDLQDVGIATMPRIVLAGVEKY